MTIFAVHGFLGSGQDWQGLKNKSEHTQNLHWITPSLFDKSIDIQHMQNYESTVSVLRDAYLQSVESHGPGSRKFIGYSLGGRLGLHWMAKYPKDFDHWVFLSTHPGLELELDRTLRLESDHKWIVALNELDQAGFMKLWNGQEVFKNSVIAKPTEKSWSPEHLKTALDQLSLARQKDFADAIRINEGKISWVVGRQDIKFLNLAEKLKKDAKFDLHILNGGHRIYLDCPEQILRILGIPSHQP